MSNGNIFAKFQGNHEFSNINIFFADEMQLFPRTSLQIPYPLPFAILNTKQITKRYHYLQIQTGYFMSFLTLLRSNPNNYDKVPGTRAHGLFTPMWRPYVPLFVHPHRKNVSNLLYQIINRMDVRLDGTR